jgi:hypothetical protein
LRVLRRVGRSVEEERCVIIASMIAGWCYYRTEGMGEEGRTGVAVCGRHVQDTISALGVD